MLIAVLLLLYVPSDRPHSTAVESVGVRRRTAQVLLQACLRARRSQLGVLACAASDCNESIGVGGALKGIQSALASAELK